MTLTSRPVVSYFEIKTRHGLGGAIYMLLSDAGVEFDRETLTLEQWRTVEKERLLQSGLDMPRPTLPAITIDGQRYHHHFPILHLLARRLDKYLPRTDQEIYAVESLIDVLSDLRAACGRAHYSTDEACKQTFREEEPRYLATLDRYLARIGTGPYDLGGEPSYAAFSLYTHLADNVTDVSAYPHLQQFKEAMSTRAGVKIHHKPQAN